MWFEILFLSGFILFFTIILISVRKNRFGGGGSMGNALQEFHATFEPGVRDAIEEKQMERKQEDESVEPAATDNEQEVQ